MSLTPLIFPIELWLEICKQLESELADTAAKHGRGIVSALSSLSRSCRALHRIATPFLYTSPVLVGMRSLTLYSRTIVQDDNLASMAQMIRWYARDRGDTGWIENNTCSPPRDRFKPQAVAKLHLLGFMEPGIALELYRPYKNYSKYNFPELLPLFLPNLKTLDYQYSSGVSFRTFAQAEEYTLPLTDIRIRASPQDHLCLDPRDFLFMGSQNTLRSLHLEWPHTVYADRLHQLTTLSVYDGCLGAESFYKLLYCAPRLEKFVYRTPRPPPGDRVIWADSARGNEDEEDLCWATIIPALSQVKNTLQWLELDLVLGHFKNWADWHAGLVDFRRLKTVILGEDAIYHMEILQEDILLKLLPKRLEHLELRQMRCDYDKIQPFADAVQDGRYPRLETIDMDISFSNADGDCTDKMEQIQTMLDSTGVRTNINLYEEEGRSLPRLY